MGNHKIFLVDKQKVQPFKNRHQLFIDDTAFTETQKLFVLARKIQLLNF